MSWKIELQRYGEQPGTWTQRPETFATRDEATQYAHHLADTIDGTSIRYARFVAAGEQRVTHKFERGELVEVG